MQRAFQCVLTACVTLALSATVAFGDGAATLPDVTGRRSNYPESTLSALPKETIAEIESTGASVVLPASIPFGTNSQLSQVYSEWYRKGYAFAFVTGMGHLPDQISRQDQPEVEQAKVLGWFDGNTAGRLAKRLKDIDSALGGIRSNRLKNP